MSWDIAAARARLGLTAGDTSKDALITTAMDISLAVAEKYCDRFFLQRSETVKFYHTHTKVFQLKRYPLTIVNKGADDAKVHHVGGFIEFDYPIIEKEVEFEYVGGYSVLPVDLEMALWGIFDNAYTQASSSGGGGISGGIKKLQITGVGSVDYDVSGGASSSTSSGAITGGLIPLLAQAILDLYRLESA